MSDQPVARDVYNRFAPIYNAAVETKPHNAYYDRPAVLGLLPDLTGKRVFDAGSGTGIYAREMLARGTAFILGVDVSEGMLKLNRERNAAALNAGRLELREADLAQPISFVADASFDVVVAPLMLDYIRDWRVTMCEFYRALRPGGVLVFSCSHPFFDFIYFKTEHYFETEYVEATWNGFSEPIVMKGYRRPLSEAIAPVLEAGFALDKLVEPLPTEQYKQADPEGYERLMRSPNFICIRARK
jgi:SAM-dependent methyltransferase